MQEQKIKKPPCARCMKVRANAKRVANHLRPKSLVHHFKQNKK